MKNLAFLLSIVFALSFNMTTAQVVDCGVSAFLEPGEPSDGPSLIQVSLRNYGDVAINSVDIHADINGIRRGTYKYVGPSLAPGRKIDLYIVGFRFNMNATYNFEFYTSNPNGVMDNNVSNDTLKTTLRGALDLENNDAGITAITAPTTISEGFKLVRVKLKNFGIDPIENVQIAWRVNGVEQPPYQYNGPLLRSRREIDLYVGGYRFVDDGSPVTISARVVLPNGRADDKPSNDRVSKEYQ